MIYHVERNSMGGWLVRTERGVECVYVHTKGIADSIADLMTKDSQMAYEPKCRHFEKLGMSGTRGLCKNAEKPGTEKCHYYGCLQDCLEQERKKKGR